MFLRSTAVILSTNDHRYSSAHRHHHRFLAILLLLFYYYSFFASNLAPSLRPIPDFGVADVFRLLGYIEHTTLTFGTGYSNYLLLSVAGIFSNSNEEWHPNMRMQLTMLKNTTRSYVRCREIEKASFCIHRRNICAHNMICYRPTADIYHACIFRHTLTCTWKDHFLGIVVDAPANQLRVHTFNTHLWRWGREREGEVEVGDGVGENTWHHTIYIYLSAPKMHLKQILFYYFKRLDVRPLSHFIRHFTQVKQHKIHQTKEKKRLAKKCVYFASVKMAVCVCVCGQIHFPLHGAWGIFWVF